VINDELPSELVEGTTAIVGNVYDVDGHSHNQSCGIFETRNT
jgi:hypothetical protein